GGGSGTADGDRLAAGRPVPRPAHLLREQDGPNRRRLRAHGSDDPGPAPRRAAGPPAALGTEADFVGVIDLVEMRAHRWATEMGEEWEDADVPPEMRDDAARAHHELFEKLADHDETLMEKFVHEQEPTGEELRRAIRRATLAGEGVPVLCGSAFKNKAIQPLLD